MADTHFQGIVIASGFKIGDTTIHKVVYGYQEELTNDTEKEIDTGLDTVLCVIAVESEEAGDTPAQKILAYKSETAGKIKLKAKGATGTTKVNWIAIGD